jgi:hypothetical protein
MMIPRIAIFAIYLSFIGFLERPAKPGDITT